MAETGGSAAKETAPASQGSPTHKRARLEIDANQEGESEVTLLESKMTDGAASLSQSDDVQNKSEKPLLPKVTIAMPVHNTEAYLDETFAGIKHQTYEGEIEISVRLDGCTDGSEEICRKWQKEFQQHPSGRFSFIVSSSSSAQGAGAARNHAIKQSSGSILCMHDADDVSAPNRLEEQVKALQGEFAHAIVGSRFTRIPEDATERYTRWCNELDARGLVLQRFREVTLIQPTWALTRSTFDRVGGYKEQEEDGSIALAEDLRFYYDHFESGLDRGIPENKLLHKIEKPLLQYRHLSGSVSSKTPRRLLFQIKAKAMERTVLKHWPEFTIWNAGRDGKDFIKNLSPEFQGRVRGFCDIDDEKIKRGYFNPNLPVKHLSVIHFTDAKPPIVCCVAMDRGGEFEENLASLKLTEGLHYYHFT